MRWLRAFLGWKQNRFIVIAYIQDQMILDIFEYDYGTTEKKTFRFRIQKT
jgi:hypothetical protein